MSTEIDYVNNKLATLEKDLDDTETSVGIKYICCNPLAEKTLLLSVEEISKMSSLECSISKMVLAQHTLFIQKQINRATAIRNWATRNLDIVVSKEIVYDGTFFKYEVKRDKLIKSNSYAARLNDIIMEQQAKVDSLAFIAKSVSDLAGALSTIYSAKMGMEHANN